MRAIKHNIGAQLKLPVERVVPIQDFTSSSDIDWIKPTEEIDKQLYNKYGLDMFEQEFIEENVKSMDSNIE